MPTSNAPRNRLAAQTSPYLLSHADNPVEWFTWGAEALDIARQENRPILLSIGYSACHWCHVMADESFSDPETAALMNELFVNIKVDREERPDLDRLYQLSHQLLTRRSGGWPLTVFLDPEDQRPFFAGTYFPDKPRHGMPSFRDVLTRVGDYYRGHVDDVRDQGERVVQAMAAMEPAPTGNALLGDAPLTAAREHLAGNFDQRHGGFGDAPKFPHPTNLTRLLRHHARTVRRGEPDREALAMVLFTLAKMGNGGLFDQLGGGFFRYSTDEQWVIPHFEKMLYDNAPLMALNAEAWLLSGHADFARFAIETGEWAMREMRVDDGGFAAALDADSEGEEGAYYVWDADRVRAELPPALFEPFSIRFGLDQPPNFEGEAWHLVAATRSDELGLSEADGAARVDEARAVMLALRDRSRILPARDDKVVTSWNGQMAAALARTGALLGRDDFVDSAHQILAHLRSGAWRDGRLHAGTRGDMTHLMGYLDDHAQVIDAILEALSARWQDGLLDWAVELADVLLEHFADDDRGGFFFTADDHETLIHRSRPMLDDALPAGNAVAARVLGRLGALLGESRYLDAAEGTLRAAWVGLERIPHGHCAMLDALEDWLDSVETVVIRGAGEGLARWHDRARLHYAPTRQTFAIPDHASSLPGLLAERAAREGEVVAYRCTGLTCGLPLDEFPAFEAALSAGERQRAMAR